MLSRSNITNSIFLSSIIVPGGECLLILSSVSASWFISLLLHRLRPGKPKKKLWHPVSLHAITLLSWMGFQGCVFTYLFLQMLLWMLCFDQMSCSHNDSKKFPCCDIMGWRLLWNYAHTLKAVHRMLAGLACCCTKQPAVSGGGARQMAFLLRITGVVCL